MSRVISLLFSSIVPVSLIASAAFAASSPVGGLTALPYIEPSMWVDKIVNGGFEGDPVLGQSGPWTPSGASSDVGDSSAAWSVDGTVSHNVGGRSMKMYGYAKAEAYQVLYLPAGSYTFTGWIKTGQGGTGRARLMVDLRRWRYETVATGCSADCGINSWYTSREISSGSNWTQVSTSFTITDADIAAAKPNMSAPGTIKAFAVLDGYWASSRLTAWYDDVKLHQQPKFPLDVFMQYPNFRGMVFTDQDETLRFRVGLTFIPKPNATYTVTATLHPEAAATPAETSMYTVTSTTSVDSSGKPYFSVTLNNPRPDGVRLMDNTNSVPYLAEFVISEDGHPMTPTYPAYRVYRAERGAMKVSFDAKNRIIVNGTPRFMLGVYDSALGSVDASTDWAKLLWDPTGPRQMTGLPVDIYLNYHLGDQPAAVINNLMDELAKETHGPVPGWGVPGETPWVNTGGTHYLQTGNCFSNSSAASHNNNKGFPIDADPAYITNGIGTKVLGYYTADECTPEMVQGVFEQYQRLISLDPDSMTFGALLGDSSLQLWRDTLDVMSTDPYPLYGAEPAGGYYHGKVAAWAAMTREAVQDSRPFMTVLQFFKFDASRSSQGRWPTKQEMRNHAYMAIVEGAKGLMWWSLGENALANACKQTSVWCTERSLHMQDLRDVATEIASLETALLADDEGAWGTVSNAAIKTKVKRVGNVDYVFAYNSTNTSTQATFSLSASPSGAVDVFGEPDRPTITPSGSTFSDTFGAFQAHVYIVVY